MYGVRCVLAQETALVQSVSNETDVALSQVPYSTVHQLG
jgi:hypothetical protein